MKKLRVGKAKPSGSSSEASSSSNEASDGASSASSTPTRSPITQSITNRRDTLLHSSSSLHFRAGTNLRARGASFSGVSDSETPKIDKDKAIATKSKQRTTESIPFITIVESKIEDPRITRLIQLIDRYNEYIKNKIFDSTIAILTLQKIDFLARQLLLEPSSVTINGWTKPSPYNFIKQWYPISNIALQFQRYSDSSGKQYTPALSTLAQQYCCELIARKRKNTSFKEYNRLSDKIQSALSKAIAMENALLTKSSNVSIGVLENNYYYSLQELKFYILSELSLNGSNLTSDKNKRRELNQLLCDADVKLAHLVKKSVVLSDKLETYRDVNEKYLADFISNAIADQEKEKEAPRFLEVFSEKHDKPEEIEITKVKLKGMFSGLGRPIDNPEAELKRLHAGNTVIWEVPTDTEEKLVIRFERAPNNGLLLERCRHMQQLNQYLQEEYLFFLQMISQNSAVGVVKITDYLQDGDLLKAVANNPDWSLHMRAYFSVQMALQIVTLLINLKDSGLVWADLKAENIGVITPKSPNNINEYKIKVPDTKSFLESDASSSDAETISAENKSKIAQSKLIGYLSIPYSPPESENVNTAIDTDCFMSWLLGVTFYSTLLGRGTGEDIAAYKKARGNLSFVDPIFSLEDEAINEKLKSLCERLLNHNPETRLTLQEAQEQLEFLREELLKLLPELRLSRSSSASTSAGSSSRFWKSAQRTPMLGIEYQGFANYVNQLKRLLKSEENNLLAQDLGDQMESFLSQLGAAFEWYPNESATERAQREDDAYRQRISFLKFILGNINTNLTEFSSETAEKLTKLIINITNNSVYKHYSQDLNAISQNDASSSKGKSPMSYSNG